MVSVQIIQSSLEEIVKWCNRNCLTIHPDKTEVMLLTRINFIGSLRPITLGDSVINFVNHSHSLGFNIDNQLNWGHHIKDLATCMAKKVKQLQRFKSLPSPILESIYYKGILPSVTYGISVWGNCSVAKLAHLEKIHLSAAKLIFKLPEIPGSLTGLPSSWKPISYLYKLKILCLTHKIFDGVCPEKSYF